MSDSNAFSHLTLDERRIIFTGIVNGSTKAAIAQTIGKDKSTVGKEIKLHRTLTHKCKMPLECNNYRKCPFERRCSLSALNTVPSTAPGVTVLPVPAMDAPIGSTVGLTNTSTALRMPTWITVLHWLIPGKA